MTREFEGARQAAKRGDPMGHAVMADVWQDVQDGSLSPVVTGQSYIFEMTTLYYVGCVVKQGPGWVHLKEASWVHWTGRKSVLMKHGFDLSKYPSESRRRPRTEYVGDWILWTGSQGCGAGPWRHALPKESVQ